MNEQTRRMMYYREHWERWEPPGLPRKAQPSISIHGVKKMTAVTVTVDGREQVIAKEVK